MILSDLYSVKKSARDNFSVYKINLQLLCGMYLHIFTFLKVSSQKTTQKCRFYNKTEYHRRRT